MALDDLMAALNAGSKSSKERNGYFTARDALSGFQFQPSRKERETGKTDWKKQLMGQMGLGLLGGVLDGLGQRKQMQDEQGKAMRLNMALSSPNPSAMLVGDPELAQYALPLQLEQYKQGQAKQAMADELRMRADADLRKQGIVPDGQGGYTTDSSITNALINQARAEKGLPPLGMTGGPSSVAAPVKQSMYNFGDKVPSVEDKLIGYQQRLGATMDPDNAAKRAAELVKGERDYAAKSFKKMDEARAKAETLRSLADTAAAGAEAAGYTGPYNGLATMGANVLSFFGNQDQTNKLAGQSLLDSIKPDIVKASRSPGAVSEYENRMYLAAGPNSGNLKEQNDVLIQKMRNLSQMEADYADFLDTYTNEKGTSVGADQLWQSYVRQYPLFTPPAADGTIDVNTQRPSWQQFFSRGGTSQEQAPQMQAPTYQMTEPQQQQVPPGMMLQRNRRTGETRLVPIR